MTGERSECCHASVEELPCPSYLHCTNTTLQYQLERIQSDVQCAPCFQKSSSRTLLTERARHQQLNSGTRRTPEPRGRRGVQLQDSHSACRPEATKLQNPRDSGTPYLELSLQDSRPAATHWEFSVSVCVISSSSVSVSSTASAKSSSTTLAKSSW